MKKQRGIFLVAMISLLIIGDLQVPYYLANPAALRTVYSSLPWWYASYALLGLASNIAIIIGMWQPGCWQRWDDTLLLYSQVVYFQRYS